MNQLSEGETSALGELTPRDISMNAEPVQDNMTQPGIAHNQTIGNLQIENSHDIHIGPEYRAEQLVILHSPTNDILINNSLSNLFHTNGPVHTSYNQGSEEQSRESSLDEVAVTAKTQFLLCMAYGIAILVMIIIVLVWKYESPDETSGNSTTISPSRPTTTVEPPKDWFVNVTQWSLVNNTLNPNYMNKKKTHLAIDDTNKGSCSTESECIEYLVDMQKQLPKTNNNINYNYLVGGDGRVYEARGNDYPPDKNQDFSEKFIKVAFIGMYKNNSTLGTLQKDGLDMIIQLLIQNNHIIDEYTIVPQCCRNIPGESGPAPKIIEYLHHHYAMNWMKNTCPCVQNINTTITTEAPWW